MFCVSHSMFFVSHSMFSVTHNMSKRKRVPVHQLLGFSHGLILFLNIYIYIFLKGVVVSVPIQSCFIYL